MQALLPKNITEIAAALDFMDEHPQRSLIHCEAALKEAIYKNDVYSKVFALTILGKANQHIGLHEDALQRIDSAKVLAEVNGFNSILVEIIRAESDILIQLKRVKDGLNTIELGLKLAKKSNSIEMQVGLLLIQGDALRELNRLNESKQAKQKAMAIAEAEDNPYLIAECYHSIGSNHFRLSQFADAAAWYSKARLIREELNDTLGLISILKNLSLANRDLGKLEEAAANLREALALSNTIGNLRLMADSYHLLGSLALRANNSNESLEYYTLSSAIRKREGYLNSLASTLENLSRVHRDLAHFEDATQSLRQAIDIRKELQDALGLASAYNIMGSLYSDKGDLAEALKYYLMSLRIRQDADFDVDIARSYTNIGLTYRKMGSHRNALKYFSQALELVHEKTDPITKAYIHIHIGNTLRDLSDPTNALISYKKALELRRRTDNPIIISQALRSVANAYSDLNKYNQAKNYLGEALALLEGINDEKGIADVYNEMGNIALKENYLDDALIHFQHAALLFGKHFELDKRGLCLRKIGEIQIKQNQFTNAMENLKLALAIGERTNNKKLVELTLLALHDFYMARGEHRQALQYYQQHIQLRDSLESLHQQEAIWQASLDLELDKKAEEIKKIESEVELLRTEAKLKTIELEQQKLIRNFFVVVSLFILIIAMGSFYGFFIIKRKNSWLNEANEKLAQSENNLKKLVQTKDKLFSIIAHDLRSPFTALVGLTEVLNNQFSTLGPQEVKEYSGLINESSQKLLNLIENLLHWSRSQTGKLSITPARLSPKEISQEILGFLEIQANSKGINLTNDIPGNIIIKADYDTISTVIRNLVSNAIKFTQPGGSVTLTGKQKGDVAVVEITDTGVGIGSENITKLFELDGNFSTKGTNEESGTGLGLIVCKEFVEKNGGTISVDSKEGHGTTFYITLPLHLSI